ncbi:MAG: hypothetical protein MZU97_02795 [Bacillus subtilis]|nr:hypothetical protein [Bacillus subtilis]
MRKDKIIKTRIQWLQMLITMIITIFILISVWPIAHLKMMGNDYHGVDAVICLKNEGAADLSSPACSASINSCKYNMGKACSPDMFYALNQHDDKKPRQEESFKESMR